MGIKSGIYCIENLNGDKKYIGSSQNVFKRRNRHFSELKNDKHKNCKLQAYYNKYGRENLRFYVLEFVENEKLLINREQFFIDKEKPWFNINLIANSSLGVKRSKETKEKVRQANLGLKHPEWRNKIKSKAQGGENHWTQKKVFSEEAKIKMSETHKKLYESGYENPRKGVKESKELVEEKRKRASKPIQQFTLDGKLVEEFSSAKEAHEKYGYSQMHIGKACNNKIKQYKKYVWKFKK